MKREKCCFRRGSDKCKEREREREREAVVCLSVNDLDFLQAKVAEADRQPKKDTPHTRLRARERDFLIFFLCCFQLNNARTKRRVRECAQNLAARAARGGDTHTRRDE